MNASDQEDRSPESGERRLAELIATRRAKIERLRAEGAAALPYRYEGVGSVEDIHRGYAHLQVGEETAEVRRVAGRLSARRGQGKAAFVDLVDRSGRLQLHARLDVLGEDAFQRLLMLDLGDMIGAQGTVMRSRRGELSLRLDSFQLLAKALRPPPDKHHGLTDLQTRHRQRELDLMANEGTRSLFVQRARIISAVRSFLDEQGFLEVETPVLQPLYGGAAARPFMTHHNTLDRTMYLRIATELYLKRCIVGGLERVYELGKDFRNEGISSKHNPEFTMVEWYEAYADYNDGAERLEQLMGAVARSAGYQGELDFATPWRRLDFVQAIAQATGIDVMAHPSVAELAQAIDQRGLGLQTDDASWPQLADDLLSKFVEPTLQEPTFIFDYPIELSPFAREHRLKRGVAERWEAFVCGMEIANAFSELNDPDIQRERFKAQQQLAAAGDEEAQPFDELFLEALEYGMPPTAGVGLGIDRLVMALTGQRSIREVVLFPAMRD
jgi:lysyl-tRNA synthetase, class II